MNALIIMNISEKKSHGVLQGSILVPLLFNIYTLPLALIMESVTDPAKYMVITHNSSSHYMTNEEY